MVLAMACDPADHILLLGQDPHPPRVTIRVNLTPPRLLPRSESSPVPVGDIDLIALASTVLESHATTFSRT
jgi:hypothetical protein